MSRRKSECRAVSFPLFLLHSRNVVPTQLGSEIGPWGVLLQPKVDFYVTRLMMARGTRSDEGLSVRGILHILPRDCQSSDLLIYSRQNPGKARPPSFPFGVLVHSPGVRFDARVRMHVLEALLLLEGIQGWLPLHALHVCLCWPSPLTLSWP